MGIRRLTICNYLEQAPTTNKATRPTWGQLKKLTIEGETLVKEQGQLTAIEVKSSMTYQPDFAKTLKLLPQWTSTPVRRRAVVYGGDFENTAGDISLLRYDHVEQLFD